MRGNRCMVGILVYHFGSNSVRWFGLSSGWRLRFLNVLLQHLLLLIIKTKGEGMRKKVVKGIKNSKSYIDERGVKMVPTKGYMRRLKKAYVVGKNNS